MDSIVLMPAHPGLAPLVVDYNCANRSFHKPFVGTPDEASFTLKGVRKKLQMSS